MTPSYPLLNDLDLSKIHFGAVRREKNGQTIIPISVARNDLFDYESRLRFQIGEHQDAMVKCRFGLNRVMEGQNPNEVDRRSMEVSLSPELSDVLERLDQIVQEKAVQHATEWFKNGMQKQYKPLVRTWNNDKLATIRIRVRGDSATPILMLANNDEVVKTSWTTIVPGTEVLAVVDTPGIWFNPAQYGIALTVRSLMIRLPFKPSGLNVFHLRPGLRCVDAPTSAEASSRKRERQEGEAAVDEEGFDDDDDFDAATNHH